MATPCAPSKAKEPLSLSVHAKGDVPTNTALGEQGGEPGSWATARSPPRDWLVAVLHAHQSQDT